MITAEIILDSRRKSQKGYPIKIRIYDGKKHKYINLKIYQSGDKLERTAEIRKKEAELYQSVEYINQNSFDIDTAIEVIKKGGRDREIEIILLKKRIAELERLSSIGFIEFTDIRIKEKESISESVRSYRMVKSAVQSFLFPNEDIPMNGINYEFLINFINHKKSGGASSGVNSYLRGMRAIYKEAQRRESLGIKKDNPFLGLISTTSRKKSVQVGNDDLQKLLQYAPPKSTTLKNNEIIQRNIDIFLFQFAIGGHDYADIANLQWSNLKNGRVQFYRFKNRNKPSSQMVDNMLNDFALGVIEKYGTKRSERIFSFIPEPKNETEYTNFRNVVYRSLKRVSDNIGIERISTKSPRYLFRSFSGELLIDTFVIMQLQGHTPMGVTFGYQRALPYEVIDKEHKKVLDLVFKSAE